MFQPLATPSHAAHLHSSSSQWTVTYPTLVAPRPLRPSHTHYHPYNPAQVGRSGSARHTRVPPRLRVVPSPAEALARISLVDQPTPPPDVPDESQSTISTLSSETLEEFLRILQNGARPASPVQTLKTEPEPENHVSLSRDDITSSPAGLESGQNPPASAPAVWDNHARETSKTPDVDEPMVPMTAPIAPCRPGRTSSCVVRKRTRTRSQSPARHDRWSHPYRRETCSGSDKSSKHSRGSSISLEEPPSLIRPSPRRWASQRASTSSSVFSETDVSEPADLGSSQTEDIELASNRGDVDDEELLARSADTEFDSSTCGDGPKRASVRGRMVCTPASPISRRHTSNPLAHYSPMLFETLAARARANAFSPSPSHSRSPSPTPAPHIADPLDEDEEDADADEYQPASVIRMEMPRSSSP